MNARDAERISAVRGLLEAARELVAAAARLTPRISAASGLSAENVAYSLCHHLETDASDVELASLVRVDEAPRVHVILSANVFVAALRAIAIARAASDRVTVRPSRREPELARALVAAAACPEIQLAEDVAPMDVAEGEIHVYGRDDTIARVRAAARPEVRVRGHGAGMGIAFVGERADLAAAADALAADVVPFDQRGCLSPRVALVAGGARRAEDFASELHAALAAWQTRIPRGRLSTEEEETAARYAETMTFAGRVFRAPDHVVAVAPAGTPLAVPPPGRHVHVANADAAHIPALLAPLARAIVAVGASEPDLARPFAPAHARVLALGRMQQPPLDGPVDLRAF